MSNTLQKIKDQVLQMANGDLIYEMMQASYELGKHHGYLEAEEKYKPVLENYQKLVELYKKSK